MKRLKKAIGERYDALVDPILDAWAVRRALELRGKFMHMWRNSTRFWIYGGWVWAMLSQMIATGMVLFYGYQSFFRCSENVNYFYTTFSLGSTMGFFFFDVIIILLRNNIKFTRTRIRSYKYQMCDRVTQGTLGDLTGSLVFKALADSGLLTS